MARQAVRYRCIKSEDSIPNIVPNDVYEPNAKCRKNNDDHERRKILYDDEQRNLGDEVKEPKRFNIFYDNLYDIFQGITSQILYFDVSHRS